jgi:TolA-binding protein
MNMPDLVYEPEKRVLAKPTATPAAAIANPVTSASGNKQMVEMFQKGEGFFNSGKYEEARVIFKSLSELKEPKNPEEDKIIENAIFKSGMCLSFLKQFDEAYGVLSTYVKKYPKGERVKDSIFNLASISETKGEKEKAIMLYNKVASLPPEDSITDDARAKIAELKG